MKLLAAALPAVAAVGFFVGVHAETPWFATKSSEMVSFASSSMTINPGQSIVMATVPGNKRLVITDINVQTVGGTGNPTGLQLEQRDSSGTITLKVPETILANLFCYPTLGHSDGHGVVFAPGADAVFKFNVNASGPTVVTYLLNGYLADK